MPTAHMTREIFQLFLSSGEGFSELDCEEIVVHGDDGPEFICTPAIKPATKENHHAKNA